LKNELEKRGRGGNWRDGQESMLKGTPLGKGENIEGKRTSRKGGVIKTVRTSGEEGFGGARRKEGFEGAERPREDLEVGRKKKLQEEGESHATRF